MTNSKPILSVILLVYNEEPVIQGVIQSIIRSASQFSKKIEVMLVNNLSDDKSIEIAGDILKLSNLPWSIVQNTSSNTSSGFNAGIRDAKGAYVMLMGGHTLLSPDYFSRLFEIIESDAQWDCVGGKNEIVADSFSEKIFRTVLTSPFGVGNAKFRYSNTKTYTDTVPYGTYRREVFQRFGFFDESFVRNQDLEFNLRIKKRGGKILYDPGLVTYYVFFGKGSVTSLLKKYYKNGMWIGLKLLNDKKGWQLRHIIPLVFLIILLFGIAGAILLPPAGIILLILPGMHIVLGLFISVSSGNLKSIFLLPFVFLIFHLTYGLGTLVGVIKSMIRG